MEIDTEKNLNFLNTNIIIENKRNIFDTYHKSTLSGGFLNFHSNHSLIREA